MAKVLNIWAVLLLALLASASFVSVARCQEVEDEEEEATAVPDASNESAPPSGEAESDILHVPDAAGSESEEGSKEGLDSIASAPGVETAFLFPTHPELIIPAGQKSELIIGVKNGGPSPLKILGIKGTIVHPADHRVAVQNLTLLEFNNTEVATDVQSTFLYEFTPQKNLLPRDFGLAVVVFYTVESSPFASVIFNSTFEVTEPAGTFSGEFIFLVLLGLAVVGLLGFWAVGEVQKISRKSRKSRKLDSGGAPRTEEAERNEWLEGTAFAQKAAKNIAQVRSRKK